MQQIKGVPTTPSGYSAEPEPSCTVSAVPVSIPNAACSICDSEQNLQDGHGGGGLNDACLGCFYIWYDGVGPCSRPEHAHQVTHVHGDDIRAYSLKAKVAGTWPFDGGQCPKADDAEKARAASAIEARRAETENTGSVHESAVAKPDAQP